MNEGWGVGSQLKFGLNCVSVKCCTTAAGMGRGHVVLGSGGVGRELVGAPSSSWCVMWARSASLVSLVACQTARPPAYMPKDFWGAENRSHLLVLVQVPRCLRPYTLARTNPSSASPLPACLPSPAAISKLAYFDHQST